MKQLMYFFAFTLFTIFNPVTAQSRLTTDIVDTAVAAGEFETLVTAVSAANLVETLKAPGPFTVFAPTDSAFAKLPAGTVEALLNNIPALTKILTYHVVSDELTNQELLSLKTISTVQGQKLKISERSSGKVTYTYVNNSRIEASIFVKNGVIHIIDKVLMPK
jgi:uncharacterized surface protein with fasciclin (FAS1) repeats